MTDLEPGLRPALPGVWYSSSSVHRLETERIFARRWMCFGRAEEVEHPGAGYAADVAGESVLAVRDRSGRLHGFANVCRHRGSRLCDDGPNGPMRTIRCPYHGWTYGLDGRLLGVPNQRDAPGLVKQQHSLTRVAVDTWGGYLWACLEPDTAPLHSQLDPQVTDRLGSLDALAAYELDRLAVARTIVYDVAANWKSLIENFTECYHCPTIHPQLTATIPEFASGYGSISGGRWHGARLAEGVDGFSLSGTAGGPPLPGLADGERRRFYGVILLPNVFLVLVPDHVAFMRLEALAPDRTRVTCDWLFPDSLATAECFDPSDQVGLLDVTNRQDFAACESCQRNATSRVQHAGGVLLPSEHLIVDFYHWLTEALGLAEDDLWDNGPRPWPATT